MTASPRRQLFVRTALCGALAAIAAIAVSAAPAGALDYGNVISSGSNTGSITGSTNGGVTTINVGGSRGFINWSDFIIANGETVNFQFGNRNDLIVNRLFGGGQASINGILNGCLGVCDGANYGGNIWVLSSGGVLVGSNARINTGGFLASTASLTDADILDGNLNFSFSGADSGAINVLSGAQITGHGGALAFIAPVVLTSAGSTITGLDGSDVFYGAATGYNVTFAQTASDDLDLITFQVPSGNEGVGASGSSGLFLNGATTANQVYAAAVSKPGLTANILLGGSVTATTASGENGAIVLSAGGGITNGVADTPMGGDVSIAQAMSSVLTADTVSLKAKNEITMGGAVTGTLNLNAGGAIALNDVTVGQLGKVSAGTSFAYTSASTAALQLTDDITAGGTVSLTHGGDINQTSGAITAAGLTVNARSINATRANNIAGETHLTGDYVNFNAAGDLTLQVNATNYASITSGGKVTFGGGDSAGGTLNVYAENGIAQATAGLFGLDYTTFGQLISRTTGGIVLKNTGSINLAGDVTASDQAVRLYSTNGSITQTGGIITTQTLVAGAAIGIDLSGINRISNGVSGLDGGIGAVSFRNYGNFQMNGSFSAGTSMALRSDTGFINQIGGYIEADTLEAFGGLGMSLDRGNQINTVRSLTSLANNGVTLRTFGNMVLAGDVTATGQRVRLLTSNGSVTQTGGVITADVLRGQASAGFSLNEANQINALNDIIVTGGALSIRNAKDLVINGPISNTAGAVSIVTTAGALTGAGDVTASGVLVLTGGDGLNLTGALYRGESGVTATATRGDVVLSNAQSSYQISVQANAGNATLRSATLSGISGSINLGASGTATLGADSAAAVSAANYVTRQGGSGTISVVGSDANIFLNSLNTSLHSIRATGAEGTASVSVAGGFSLTNARGNNVSLSAANGNVLVGSVTLDGGDYTLLGRTFSGAGVFTPGGTVRNLSLTDTQGGLVLNNALSAQGNLTIVVQDSAFNALQDLQAGGDLSVTASGMILDDIVAGRDLVLNGFNSDVSATNVQVGRNYTLSGGDFSDRVLSPYGDRLGTWSINKALGDLAVTGPALRYNGDIAINVANGTLLVTSDITSSDGSVTARAQTIIVPTILAGTFVDLTSDNSITTTSIQALDGAVTLDAGGFITATSLTASDSLNVSAAGNVIIQAATAGDDLSLISNGGSLIVRNINMTGAGAGHDLTVRASTDLTMGADAPIVGTGGPEFQRAGTGSTTIESTSGSAKIHFNASANTITRLGDVTANAVSIAIKSGVVEMNNVTARTGSVAIQGGAQVTVAGTINTALNLLVDTYSLNLLSVVAGADVNIMTQRDLAVGSATAGDDISIISASGTTSVRSATLTGAGADIDGYGYNLQIGSGSGTTFGADNEAGITSANAFTRLSGTGSASISSMMGPVNVYLADAASFTSLSAGGMFPTPPRALNAVVATGNLTIGNLYAGSASLKAGGTLSLGGISGLNGNYAVTAADFGGVALAPTGTLNNVTIVDTAGGLTLVSPITVNGLLTIESSGALLITGVLSGAGGVRVESHGGLTLAGGASLSSSATGDAIVLASDGAFINNAGASALTAANGRWLIYTQAQGQPTSATANVFGGLTAKNFYGSTYNFATDSFSTAPNAGNRIVYGYRPTLTVTPVSQTVTYSGAIPTVSALITGLINGDLASDAWGGSPLISGATSKNVGAYALLASLGTLASDLNYDFAFETGLLTIDPKTLTGVFTANDKTYDGSDTATGSISLTGVVGTDDVSAGGTYRFGDKTAGAGKTVTATGVSLSGGDAGNYVLDPLATAIADILRKDLTGLLVVDNKTYDGTTAANGAISLTGVVGDDEVTAGGSYTFGDRNAGTGKTIIVSGLGLSGADADNYNLLPLAAAVADILRKDLTGLLTAQNKTYDGTTTATGSISLGGVVGDDDVSAGGSYSFGDKNAGTGKTVTANGIILSGADAENYNLLPLTAAIADILRKDLTGLLTAQTKTYDGTATATGSISLTGIVGDDDVSASGSYVFGDKNAGTGKIVTAVGVTLNGADAGNYTLQPLTAANADILRKSITGVLVAEDKTYDGSVAANGSVVLTGVIVGDQVSASGVYAFDDRNAGFNKTVTVSNTLLGGVDSANYELTSVNAGEADILRRKVTLSADDLRKRYGQSDPALTWHIASGSLVAGDTVSGVLVREAGEEVGRYLIAQGSLNLSNNYDLTFNPGSLFIDAVPSEGFAEAQRFLNHWRPSLQTDRSPNLTIIDERDAEED